MTGAMAASSPSSDFGARESEVRAAEAAPVEEEEESGERVEESGEGCELSVMIDSHESSSPHRISTNAHAHAHWRRAGRAPAWRRSAG